VFITEAASSTSLTWRMLISFQVSHKSYEALCHGSRHIAANPGATSAFRGAIPAQGMMRRMLFADFRAPLAHVCTGSTEHVDTGRESAHPPRGQRAEIGAISAQPDAQRHQSFLVAAVHADHVIRTAIANLGTWQTGIYATLKRLGQYPIVLMHNAPFLFMPDERCSGNKEAIHGPGEAHDNHEEKCVQPK
jgi:hypothetical protein